LCRHLLRSQAAFRLSPDSPIKALDPAGIASYCLLLLIDRKLRIYFWGLSEKPLTASHYTIVCPSLST